MKSDMSTREASEQERYIEGAHRARLAGLGREVIDALARGEVMTSQNQGGDCKVRSTSLTEALVIQDMQDATGGTVWHAIRTNIGFIGDVLIMLYVSNDKRDWPAARGDAESRVAEVYVTALPGGSSDDAQAALRLTSSGLYATYLHLATNKLARTQRKALD